MIIFLLGYGLVEVPKELFKKSNYKSYLKYLEYIAGENQRELNIKKSEQYEIQKKINFMRDYEFNEIHEKELSAKLYFNVRIYYIVT